MRTEMLGSRTNLHKISGLLLVLPYLVFIPGCQFLDVSPKTSSDDKAMLKPLVVNIGNTPFPEGIASTDEGVLFSGSLTTGQIVTIRDAGLVEPFATLNYGAIGLKVDETRNLLWACDGSPFDPKLPTDLVALSLDDGSRVATHPIPVAVGGLVPLCDDMFVTEYGDVFVTDVHSSNVHILPAVSALADGTPTKLWADNTGLLSLSPGGLPFGANGIARIGDYLYVSNSSQSKLVQIEIRPDGSAGARQNVPLFDSDGNPHPFLIPDGIFAYQGGLYAIQTPSIFDPAANSMLVRIMLNTSGDIPFGEAAIVAEGLDTPTAVVVNDGMAWITVSQFDHLFEVVSEPVEPFQIVGIPISGKGNR